MVPIYELTQQERTVLALVARGWRNAAVARELVISTRTVETHLYHIFDKLQVSSRTEATLLALQSGLVSYPEISRTSDDKVNANDYAMNVR
jgi:DNA-binding NarL/FixJ family response regulator